MNRIDRFLGVLVSRGGMILRLSPGDSPVMELPGGHRVNISTQELLGTVLDGLAKEILPEELQTEYLRGERVSFEYGFEQGRFQVVCTRTKFGTNLILARLSIPQGSTPSGSAGTAPLSGSEILGRLDPLIRRLLGAGGSDLYLCGDEGPVMRRSGHVEPMEDFPAFPPKLLDEILRPLLPPPCLEAYQAGADTEFTHAPEGQPFRLRLRIQQDHKGPAVAIRVIPKTIPDADTLGLSDAVRRLSHLDKGLVLIAGPAGSGKSTTQACLLELAQQHRKAFTVTIQDSLEFDLGPGSGIVRQREIGRDPRRHQRAVRAAIQQAPDILAVGEIRDAETANLALQAAQTGRLVLAQVPANGLVDTLYFFVDAFPESHRSWVLSRLADQLKALLVHTLVHRVGGGQVASVESLFNNPSIAGLLREGRLDQIPTAMRSGRYGQVSHNEALIRLIQAGQVEAMEAYLRCQDRETFIAACKKAGIPFDPRGTGEITDI